MEEKDIVGKPMPDAKPLVQIACIAEKVLIEPDNVASLIRVVDTYNLPALPEAPAPGVLFQTELTAFISLKSGDVVGEFEVGLRLRNPDGKDSPIRMWKTEFLGGEQGVNMKIAFTLTAPKFGFYWFDVLWGHEVLTRIPFRLKSIPQESKTDAVVPSETATR